MRIMGIIASLLPALLLVGIAILQALGKINVGGDADTNKKLFKNI